MKKSINLIEGFLDSPDYINVACINANAINEKNNLMTYVLTNSKKKISLNKDLFDFFKINNIINMLSNPVILLICIIKSLFSTRSIKLLKNKSDVLLYKKEGILLGDLLYDSYIRLNDVYDYKDFQPSNKKFVRHFIKSMIYYYYYIELLKRYDVKYVILSHRIYLQYGLLGRLVQQQGGNVIIPWRTAIRCYYTNDDLTVNHWTPKKDIIQKITANPMLLEKIDKYLTARFEGNVNQYDVKKAFTNKENISKEELIKLLNLDPGKPLIYLMPHVFSDAPHCNERMIYNDFWDWFEHTIQLFKVKKNANWIIKQHPSASLYGEHDEIIKYLKDNDCQNVFFFPTHLSSKVVFDTADSIITCHGTAALEAACMGIKPILCGAAPFSNLGIAFEPKDEQEYSRLLDNIGEEPKILDEKQKNIAKAVLYWIQELAYVESEIISDQLIIPDVDKSKVVVQMEEMKKYILNKLSILPYENDNYFKCLRKLYKENKQFLGYYNL